LEHNLALPLRKDHIMRFPRNPLLCGSRCSSIACAGSAALALAAGCSGGPVQGVQPQQAIPTSNVGAVSATSIDLGVKELAVTDGGGVHIFNNAGKIVRQWKLSATPSGDAYDNAGNLYVAIQSPPEVLEFRPGARASSFKYSTGLTQPISVTTDSRRNVYVLDAEFGGLVTEYRQKKNSALKQCDFNRHRGHAIAIDRGDGAVFVSYDDASTSEAGYFIEFAAGLQGCGSKYLDVGVGAPGGIAINSQHRLIAGDSYYNAIDIIKRPYRSITSHFISIDPVNVALNEKQSLLFIIQNYGSYSSISVVDYPEGTDYMSLGRGLNNPVGVAAY
jgi:hypothetical protein